MASKRPTRKQLHDRLVRQTRKQYPQMLAAQGGHCALCPSTGGTRRLHIDVDHKTMTVRGLLCFQHNVLLRGYMKPELLRAAADYLERPPYVAATTCAECGNQAGSIVEILTNAGLCDDCLERSHELPEAA